MAYASTDTRPSGTRPGARLAEFFSGLAEGYQRYSNYRDTVGELSSLSDRDLQDLGIARHQIPATAARAAFLGD